MEDRRGRRRCGRPQTSVAVPVCIRMNHSPQERHVSKSVMCARTGKPTTRRTLLGQAQSCQPQLTQTINHVKWRQPAYPQPPAQVSARYPPHALLIRGDVAQQRGKLCGKRGMVGGLCMLRVTWQSQAWEAEKQCMQCCGLEHARDRMVFMSLDWVSWWVQLLDEEW